MEAVELPRHIRDVVRTDLLGRLDGDPIFAGIDGSLKERRDEVGAWLALLDDLGWEPDDDQACFRVRPQNVGTLRAVCDLERAGWIRYLLDEWWGIQRIRTRDPQSPLVDSRRLDMDNALGYLHEYVDLDDLLEAAV